MATKEKYKTTTEDFEYFKKCCNYWMERLELNEWKIKYDQDMNYEKSIAEYEICYVDRQVTFKLALENTEPLDKKTIIFAAFHEVVHCLLYPSVYTSWNHQEEEREAADHAIINRLAHYLNIKEMEI